MGWDISDEEAAEVIRLSEQESERRQLIAQRDQQLLEIRDLTTRLTDSERVIFILVRKVARLSDTEKPVHVTAAELADCTPRTLWRADAPDGDGFLLTVRPGTADETAADETGSDM
jgi:hypothetical protein